MATQTNPKSAKNRSPKRRSQRVLMSLAVRVHGYDAAGGRIDEETQTLAINAHGALVLMKSRVTSGGQLFLMNKRTEEEQECHVVFLGPVRGGKAEIGLEFTEARPGFWRVTFPPEDWTPRHPEARSIVGNRSDK
jgi:hypothetical protein